MCVSSAPERGGGGEGAERERERVPRLVLRPTDIVDLPVPPPSKKKKIPQPSVIACASLNSL